MDIVIARYNEDLDWLKNVTRKDCRIFVYNKGHPLVDPNPTWVVEERPNVGREAESFIYHIMQNYDNMKHCDDKRFTMFMQGKPFDHISVSRELFIHLLNKATSPEDFGNTWYIAHCAGDGSPHHPGINVDEAYAMLQLPLPPPPFYRFIAGAQFPIENDLVTIHDLDYWKTLHTKAINLEVCAWCFERLWFYIFGGSNDMFGYCL